MSQFTTPRPQLLQLRKPRNPLVGPSLMRQAGRHGASQHGQRQEARRQLQQALRQLREDRRSP